MRLKKEKLARFCSLIGAHFVMAPLSFAWNYGNLSAYMDSYFRYYCYPGCVDGDSEWILTLFISSCCPGLFVSGLVTKRLGLKLSLTLGIVLNNGAFMASAWMLQVSVIGTAVLMGFLSGISMGISMSVGFTYVNLWAGENNGFFIATATSAPTALSILENQIITKFVNHYNLKTDARVGNKAYFSQVQILEKVPQIIIILAGIHLGFGIAGLVLVSSPQPSSFDERSSAGCSSSSKNEDKFEDASSTAKNADLLSSNPKDLSTTSSLINCDEGRYYHSNCDFKNVFENLDSVDCNAHGISSVTTRRENCIDEGITKNSHADRTPYSYKPSETIRTKSFYALWLYTGALGYGLILKNSYYKRFALLYINDDRFLTLIGSLIPVVASFARIILGSCMDKGILTLQDCMVLTVSLNSVLCSFWFFIPQLNSIGYLIFVLALASVHSTTYTMAAYGAFQLFGPDNFPQHLAMAYSGAAAAAILAAIFIPPLLQAAGWFWLFFTCGGFSMIVLIFTVTSAINTHH
ncbi:oxalate:formate antiporter [Plakobranchus ocellatus]|uniref:Oxalate:formate antiporter n=1 Tax=Plakobranchus ocellatus TaxID=259542 RepID=A0AAV3YS01_9GAST|nr:oxalate:formate antiporter [Plakobranchus ocellatus]